MKLLILFLTIVQVGFSQIKATHTITTKSYTAYINKEIKMPVYVKYILYKGGGPCERPTDWKNDSKYPMTSDAQYAKSGYDKGHLVNAEDFAYDCALDKLTFMEYNRLPQTPELNRGIWKSYESIVRQVSQRDSLLIFCGGYWNPKKKIIVNGMLVPNECWKVIWNLSKGRLVGSFTFTNDKIAKDATIDLEKLESKLGYQLGLRKPVKTKNVK